MNKKELKKYFRDHGLKLQIPLLEQFFDEYPILKSITIDGIRLLEGKIFQIYENGLWNDVYSFHDECFLIDDDFFDDYIKKEKMELLLAEIHSIDFFEKLIARIKKDLDVLASKVKEDNRLIEFLNENFLSDLKELIENYYFDEREHGNCLKI